MHFEAAHDVLAVVVVELVGTVAVEHAEAVVDDAEFLSVLRFDGEEATRGHDTEVATQGTHAADIAVACEFWTLSP